MTKKPPVHFDPNANHILCPKCGDWIFDGDREGYNPAFCPHVQYIAHDDYKGFLYAKSDFARVYWKALSKSPQLREYCADIERPINRRLLSIFLKGGLFSDEDLCNEIPYIQEIIYLIYGDDTTIFILEGFADYASIGIA